MADTCSASGPAREARLRLLWLESLRAVPPGFYGLKCFSMLSQELQAVHGVVPGRQRVTALVSMQGSDWPEPSADKQGAKEPR